jgi:hypothetical protein
VLVAACLLAAACGGASHSGGSNGGSQSTTATTTGAQLSPAQARALAARVNLRPADVPGFHVASKANEGESQRERRIKLELLACAGASHFPGHGVVEVDSPSFERHGGLGGAASIQSELALSRSAALAREELAALRSARGARCLARAVQSLLGEKHLAGAKLGPVAASQGTPPAPGADGSFALRLTVPVSASGLTLHAYIDLLGFVRGPVEVTLFTSSLPLPLPGAVEERLFSLLLERAQASGA